MQFEIPATQNVILAVKTGSAVNVVKEKRKEMKILK